MADLKANRSIRDTRHKEEWHVRTPRTNYDKQSLTHTVPILLNQLAQEDFDPLCNSNNEIRLSVMPNRLVSHKIFVHILQS